MTASEQLRGADDRGEATRGVQETLAFRTAYGVPLFWLLLMGAVVAAIGWLSLTEAPEERGFLIQAHCYLMLIWGACCVWALLLWRARITLDAGGIRYRSLWRKDEIPWADVEEVTASFGGFFHAPTIALLLRRPERLHSVLGSNPARFVLGLHWRNLDDLVAAVIARAPQARVSDTTREWLARTHRVPWRHRLGPLVACAVSACAFGYALCDLLAWQGNPFFAVSCSFAATILCGSLGGGAIDHEWRWKSWLVRATALLGPLVFFSAWPMLMFGRCGPLTMSLAVAFGWAVVTTAVCLPIRPRGWPVAMAYATTIAGAAFAAWWFAVREPLPCRKTKAIVPSILWHEWSQDGRLLCGLGLWQERKHTPVCHVVDAASVAVRTFPLSQREAWGLLPAGSRHALFYGSRGKEDKALSALWAIEFSTGKETLVHPSPFGIAPNGFLSPDGQEAVFLAGTDKPNAIVVLRLADLTTRKLETTADISRFGSVRWRPDGKLLLVERQHAEKSDTLAFWRLGPREKEPKALYRATGRVAYAVHWQASPDVRWAVVKTEGGEAELVDMADGKSKALVPQPASDTLSPCGWSPDGTAFIYVAREAGTNALVVFWPRSGRVARPYRTDLAIRSVSLSRSGRYAACETERQLACHLRIIDTGSGRVFGPRGISIPSPLSLLAWSPVGYTLAVQRHGNPIAGELSGVIHLYELPP